MRKSLSALILVLFAVLACNPSPNESTAHGSKATPAVSEATPIVSEGAPTVTSKANQLEALPTQSVSTQPQTKDEASQFVAGDKWSLWVNGPHLRGANIWQAVVVPELDGLEFKGSGTVGPPFSQEDFYRLAELGANYVSISGPGLFTETPPYTVDPDVQENLDNLLAMIAEADMFATIGFRTGPGRSEYSLCCDGDPYFDGYFNDTVWEDQAAQDAWVEMWRYTAERYGGNPIVAGYKLMVEPNANGILLDMYDPDEFYAEYANTLYDWNQFYPKIVDGIRQVDANTPILVGGMSWSGVEWLPYLQPTDDPRTVYVIHQYEPQDQYTHQEPDGENTYPGMFDTDWDNQPDQFNRAWLDNLLSTTDEFAATHGVPMSVDEFGVVRWVPNAAEFMDDQMDLFEQRGMNHALWEWSTSWEPFAEDVNHFNFRLGPGPDNRAETPNALMNVITRYWSRNTIRPSNFGEETITSSPAEPSGNGTRDDEAITADDAARPDGAVRLTNPSFPASDQNPAFSPAGTHLLFTRFERGYNEGPSALYLFDLTTGHTRLLTAAPDSDDVNLPGSSWNAATQRITFSSDREGIDEIWTMTPEGDDLFQVTHHTTPDYFIEPSFSPDGQWIVFEADSDTSDIEQLGSIWKIRADGTGLTQLTHGADDRQPNWSPTGERILWQRRLPGSDDWNLYTAAPDGSDIQQVATTPSGDTDAAWSPDGQWIVYSSDYDDLPNPNIFVIPARGGEPARVTYDETRYDGAPSWSPDGQWLAFESHPGDNDAPTALWRIAAPVNATAQITPTDYEVATAKPKLADVTHWLYLIDVNLEDDTLEQIIDSEYDMVVFDFIPSEANNTDYPMVDVVERLHNAPHPKLVIAYIDIGQAEDYRTYWQPGWKIGDPEWIVGGDPDGWEGNYPVAYWWDEWQDVWLGPEGTLQAILDADFDGIYLDWVEAYSDENVVNAAENEDIDPRQEMIWFVGDMAEFARSQNPTFIVIGQNAAELATSDEYVDTIDAIAQEQVWFDGGADNDPPGDCPLPRTEADIDTETYYQSLSPKCRQQYDDFPESTLHVSSEEYLQDLTLAQNKGVLIFTVDYALEMENVEWVYKTSRSLGFVPFVGSRALDQYIAPHP